MRSVYSAVRIDSLYKADYVWSLESYIEAAFKSETQIDANADVARSEVI
jgi:hypothetical protein